MTLRSVPRPWIKNGKLCFTMTGERGSSSGDPAPKPTCEQDGGRKLIGGQRISTASRTAAGRKNRPLPHPPATRRIMYLTQHDRFPGDKHGHANIRPTSIACPVPSMPTITSLSDGALLSPLGLMPVTHHLHHLVDDFQGYSDIPVRDLAGQALVPEATQLPATDTLNNLDADTLLKLAHIAEMDPLKFYGPPKLILDDEQAGLFWSEWCGMLVIQLKAMVEDTSSLGQQSVPHGIGDPAADRDVSLFAPEDELIGGLLPARDSFGADPNGRVSRPRTGNPSTKGAKPQAGPPQVEPSGAFYGAPSVSRQPALGAARPRGFHRGQPPLGAKGASVARFRG
ncbi:hypothetical protein OF83DRAFT_1149923 [Amylostereum chailletii]|nr:hypothetical protein OF83DRAFT_1149923 [Amylostereum chailletii]